NLTELTIADDEGVWLTLRDVVLDWNRSALLAGRVSVNTLTAAEILLDRIPAGGQSEASLPAPEASGFALPELPLSINIGKVAAERIVLGETVLGQPVEARLEAGMSLAGGEGHTQLVLERTDDGPAGRLALTASYSNATQVLAVDLQAIEEAGGIATALMGLPGAPAVELTVKGEGPLDDYAADLKLTSDGQERLAGRVTVGADAAGGTRFTADLGGDLAPLFLPDYAAFFGPDVQFSTEGVRAADGRLDLSRFALDTQAMKLDGSLALAADGLPERFDLAGRIARADGGPVLLPLTTNQRTMITTADLKLAFDTTKGENWTADVTLTGFERADFTARNAHIIGGGTIARPGGKPRVDGTLDLAAEGLVPADPALARALGQAVTGTIGFRWQEGQETLDLPVLKLNGQDYGLDAVLRIAGLHSALTVSGTGRARADDLARFADLTGRPLAGSVSATIQGEAALLAGSFDLSGEMEGSALRIGIAEIDNLLSGASSIGFGIRRDETGTALQRLDLVTASLTAQASGTVATAGSDIAADLDFRDLRVLGPQYRGSLKGRAHFIGTPESGTVTLDAAGSGIGIGVAELDNLLKGDAAIEAEAELAGEVTHLRRLTVNAASLGIEARGRIDPKGHDLTADLTFRDLRALGGGYRGTLAAQAAFRGTPVRGSLTATATGTDLAIGQAEADRLLAGRTRLDADLALDGGRIKINRATLANLQLQAEASGSIEGAMRRVRLQAELANLALLLPEFPGRLGISGTALDDGNGYQLDLTGSGPGGIRATVRGRINPDFRRADLAINGSAQAGLANTFIAPRAMNGNLGFDLRLNGPLQPASLSGRVSIAGLRASDPALPYALEGVGGTVNLSGGRADLAINGRLSTGGTMRLTGGVNLAPPYNADLAAELTQLILKDPQLYRTRLNGRVTVRGPLTGGAMIGGNILLNETELQIPSVGFGAATGLEELRHVNEPTAVRATRARAGLIEDGGNSGNRAPRKPYPLDLTISAPQRIFLRGRGLDVEMGGTLRLTGTTANVVPAGAFELIRGRLDILGKRLTISQALLQLEGDFDPYIRVLASNESGGITSSVMIEGRATEPRVSFVSTPPLPEEQVLARLLFGRDLTTLSAFQAAQLASAVATLAGRGGDGIVGALRRGFGLDDLDISTNAQGETSLRAGKYISANTYTEIEVDQAGKAKISLNLDLTDTVTLRGSAGGDGTSIGIFKERDY
ncbi:MAG: translocation/assembly module TamB domain-containing protein, partial [Gemmobacter sp.]|nr:translocation/assembly module TamB domain-containing protein [Gemmobacter sp.]